MIDWLGQRVGVYGYGKTGRALVDFLLPQLILPTVFIDSPKTGDEARLVAEAAGRFEFAFGPAIVAAIEQIDSLVLSPGVSLDSPNVRRARERGIPVLSELELAARCCNGYLLAVTGTNGKSTTTKLLGHVLSALGPAHALGNIGSPLTGSLEVIGEGDYVALEVSSFQLEATDLFKPNVAIYTNLTPDHLDRHGSLEEYARVKRSMTRRMGRDGFVITNALCPEFAPTMFENQQPLFLQYRSTPGNRLKGAWVANNRINIDLGQEQYEIPVAAVKLPGVHNLENAMAVILAALIAGATPDTIIERLETFTGYEHRLELCRTARDLKFYNDSKATNPEATITAIKALEPPLALILGGRDKLTDLAELCSWIRRKATTVVLYGEAAERFNAALAGVGYNNRARVENLEQAVQIACEQLGGTGSVLLSPACASFDQYTSYEARGDHFKELVAALQI